MPNSLKKKRARAFETQNGRCYYCGVRMWLDSPRDLCREHRLSENAASLVSCTAEHLIAKVDGGTDSRKNIAAACWFCNQARHRRKRALDPVQFRVHVRKRLGAKRWHQRTLRSLF